ncbi:MAG: SIR2 family protein [Planctomycetes bacterium]|nr:SIR2 family protein [Planctomycetota bacterium]
MKKGASFTAKLVKEVQRQLRGQRVGYLLGAGSSYLGRKGYPLAFDLWQRIRKCVEEPVRAAIQEKLDAGATGIEQALDRFDDGDTKDTPYRHAVTAAISKSFRRIRPPLEAHVLFLKRLQQRESEQVKIFSLNYDPLVERAADHARVRLTDGFRGIQQAYFDGSLFDESPVRTRASAKGPLIDLSKRTMHLLKLHGSLGWYELDAGEARRCPFDASIPRGARPLMVPPQRRKAADTMSLPYAALWSRFRGALAQDPKPLHRLVSIGYGFGDHHVNEVIAPVLERSDFTLLIFARVLSNEAWARWSAHERTIVVTESRCALFGEAGEGHADLWDFEHVAGEV